MIGTGSTKDPRRAAISRRYCVIAMAGDQLGDFSDLFNADGVGVRPRRAAAAGAYRRTVGQWLVHAVQPGLRAGHPRHFRRRIPGGPPLVRPARRK